MDDMPVIPGLTNDELVTAISRVRRFVLRKNKHDVTACIIAFATMAYQTERGLFQTETGEPDTAFPPFLDWLGSATDGML